MSQRVRIRLVSGATTFKLLFIGSLFSHVLAVLVAGVLAATRVIPFQSGDAVLPFMEGAPFLLAYLALGIVFVPFITFILWLGVWPGLWVYSRFRPVTVSFSPFEGRSTEPRMAPTESGVG